MEAATRLERQRAEQRHEWLKEIVAYIREFVELPKPNVPSFDIGDPLTLTDSEVESAATSVRRYWGLGDGVISDLVLLLENNGIVVSYGSLWTEHLDAFSEWAVGTPYIFAGSDKMSAARSRFDLAHELAHLVLHRAVTREMLADREAFKQLERQAHDFAGAFLLPSDAFRDAFYVPSLEVLRAMKPVWRVSIQAMLKRAERLALLSDTAKISLWRSLARRGWRSVEPLDRELAPEQPRLLRRGFELVVQSGVQSKDDIRARLPFAPQDIEELAGLDSGFLSDSPPSVRLLRMKTERPPETGAHDASSTQVLSFRVRRDMSPEPLLASARSIVMSSRKDVHTVPNPDGAGWVNKVGGREVSQHQRKDTAVDRGRDIARQNQAEHVIHNSNGRIGRKKSYGGDPNPPKDKN